MKKFYSIFVACAAAAFALVSCSKEPLSERTAPGVTRTVSFVADAAATKTAFGTPSGTTYPVLWTANDATVKVSLNLAAPVDATVAAASDFKTASFTADVTDDASGSYTFFALSPASAYSAISTSSVTAVVPVAQTPLAGSVDEAAQILVGRSATLTEFPTSTVSLQFQHFTAYGKFSVTGLSLATDETVSSITLIAPSAWSGKTEMNVSSGAIISAEKNSVKLLTSSLTDVWFACAPVDLGGKTVQVVVVTDKAVYKKAITIPSGKVFEAGKIASFSIDMSGVSPSTTDAIFVAAGYDLSDYVRKEMPLSKGYYNSSGSNYYTLVNTDTVAESFAASDIYVKSDFPKGTVLVINDGFKYRPEAWYCMYKTNPGSMNKGGSYGDRPAEYLSTVDQVKVVNANWWLRYGSKDWYFRAFNVGLVSGTALTAAERALAPAALGVYVPKVKSSTDEILRNAGYNPDNYTKLALTWTNGAFYNSTNGVALTTQANNNKSFMASNMVAKADIPNGAVIVCKEYITYRPEGWQANDSKNTASRPAAVNGASCTVVDDAWWGDFNYRAFNLQMTGSNVQWASGSNAFSGHTTVAAHIAAIQEAFAVYLPK